MYVALSQKIKLFLLLAYNLNILKITLRLKNINNMKVIIPPDTYE